MNLGFLTPSSGMVFAFDLLLSEIYLASNFSPRWFLIFLDFKLPCLP